MEFKKPKPQIAFFKPKQTSLTRRIIWHGSTAFLIGGFIWATYATFSNEQKWKTQEYKKVKDYERLVEEYRKEFERNSNDDNTNHAH